MATKTIGSASRDYATLSAWASYVNALSLSGPEIGEMYNDSEFTEASAVTIGGWSGGSSTNTVTLTTAAGQSFRDNANAQTNALRYDQSNGVGVKMTGAFTASSINFTGSNFILSNIQFTNTSPDGQHIVLFNSANANVLIKDLIVEGRLWRNDQGLIQMFCQTNSVIQNVVVIVTSSLGKGVSLLASGAGATSAYDLTVVSSGGSTGTAMDSSYTPSPVVKNCAVYGFSTDYAGTCGSSANNATDKAKFGGVGWDTSGQTSILSTEWQSVAAGSEDLRLSPNSTKLRDNGTSAGPVTDIVGTTRPQRAAYDIGCWELITFNPALVQNTSGDDLMYIKNTAGQYLGFLLLNVNTGAPVTGATVTAKRTIDGGAQANATGTVTEIGSGQYSLALSQADTNGNDISFLFAATGAVSVVKNITTMEKGSGQSGLGDPLNFLSSTTMTVPPNITQARVIVFGAGGAGGGSKNATISAASGGAGGGYAEGFVSVVPGETATITVGAGGSSSSSSGTGAAGGTSSFAVASKTISATGGGGGTISTTSGVSTAAPTPGAGSNGDINSTGGVPGAVTITTQGRGASGGASPGSQYGNGKASGSVAFTGTSTVESSASGGAGLQGASGSLTAVNSVTGGGGIFFKSDDNSSDNTAGSGGGSGGASGLALQPSITVLTSTFSIPLNYVMPVGGGGSGLRGGPYVQPGSGQDGGGGGGAATQSGNGTTFGGAGGFGGGGGGSAANGSGSSTAGTGGLFGGGGGAVVVVATSATIIGGRGNIGAGGGAAAGLLTDTITTGAGGPGMVIVQWVYP